MYLYMYIYKHAFKTNVFIVRFHHFKNRLKQVFVLNGNVSYFPHLFVEERMGMGGIITECRNFILNNIFCLLYRIQEHLHTNVNICPHKMNGYKSNFK